MNPHSEPSQYNPDRRQFIGTAAAAVVAAGVSGKLAAADEATFSGPHICSFIKFVQSLNYNEMAAAIKRVGFDGIESTVRKKGHVLPERVEEDLPKQMEACRSHDLQITMATTDVLSVDTPHAEKVLRTCADLGIKQYRMGFHRYDLKRPVMEQLDEIKPQMKDLAAMNRELGLSAVYQNHSGNNFVGSPLWDIRYVLEGIPKEEIGNAFDIRHATVEGGLSWPLDYEVMKPYIGAVYAKDFVWDGKKPKHVPLGTGRVDGKFFKLHQASGINCPISLHVEYLGHGTAEENLAAMTRDLKVLRKWLA